MSVHVFTAVQIWLSHTGLPPIRCLERDIDLQLQSNHLKTNTLPSVKKAFSLLMKDAQTKIHPKGMEDLSTALQTTLSISLV